MVYERYNCIYGYRQIQLFLLQDHGVWIIHKMVLRIMQDLGIRSRIRRKHRCNYASSEGDRVAKNSSIPEAAYGLGLLFSVYYIGS